MSWGRSRGAVAWVWMSVGLVTHEPAYLFPPAVSRKGMAGKFVTDLKNAVDLDVQSKGKLIAEQLIICDW